MLEAPQPSGGTRSVEDTTAAMQRIIDQAMELVPSTDPARRSLAHALVSFAHDIGAEVVSEGIETAAELDTVRELGVPYGQGYFLSRPTRPQLIPDSYAHVASRAPTSSC